MQHAIYRGQKSGIRIVLSSKGEQKSGVKHAIRDTSVRNGL